jgi:excisionase family DNA binding protein
MSELLSEKEVAILLGVKPQTLAIWRMKQEKLPFVRIGRLVKYQRSAIERFMAENSVSVREAR